MSRQLAAKNLFIISFALAAISFSGQQALSQTSVQATQTQSRAQAVADEISDENPSAKSLSSEESRAESVVSSVADAQQERNARGVQTFAPLTSGQKMNRAFKRAFLSPEGYMRTAFSAAITEATEEDLPHKDTNDRLADGASRFAIRFGTRATRTILGSGVFPVLFKQDPRYERSGSKNIARRALHAASRVFVARGDNGKLQPNYSRWAGSLSASALANLWEQSTPGRDRIGTDATFRRFANSFITDAWQTVVFSEFLPDVLRIFKR